MTTVAEAPTQPEAALGDGPSGRTPAAARWLRRLWPVPAALALAAAAALVPDWGGSGPAPGEAFVSVDGSARVERSDGAVEVLVGGEGEAGPAETTLRQGDGIELLTGRAELDLAGSIRMEAVAGTSLLMGRSPDLRAGDLLVTGEARTSVVSGGTRVRLDGADGRPAAVRLARTAGLSVGAYRGAAYVDSAGRAAAVAALRRVEVATLGDLTEAQPIRYDTDDAWDRRYLGGAMALDQQLARVLPGFEASAGPSAVTPAGLAAALDGIDDGPTRRELAGLVDPDRPPGDLLVGATISGLARGGAYADRWRSTFRFHDAGASWGLVALDRGVSPRTVLDALGEAIEAADLDFEDQAGSPDDPVIGGAGGGGTDDPAGGPGTTAGGGGTGGDGDGGPTTPTLPPVPTVPTPTAPTVPPITDPVGGIVGGLGDTVDDVLDGLGDAVDGLLDPEPDDPPDCLLGLVCN